MRKSLFRIAVVLTLLTMAWGNAVNAVGTRFEAGNGTFLLNGKPFVVKAAELHYPRIPKPYWDQRISCARPSA